MSNTDLIIDWATKSSLCDVIGGLAKWHKALWKEDRKMYNRLKDYKPEMQKYRSRVSYWIMQNPEVTVSRAINEIDEAVRLIGDFKKASNDSLLDGLLEKADGLRAIIVIADDHQKSFFAH